MYICTYTHIHTYTYVYMLWHVHTYLITRNTRKYVRSHQKHTYIHSDPTETNVYMYGITRITRTYALTEPNKRISVLIHQKHAYIHTYSPGTRNTRTYTPTHQATHTHTCRHFAHCLSRQVQIHTPIRDTMRFQTPLTRHGSTISWPYRVWVTHSCMPCLCTPTG